MVEYRSITSALRTALTSDQVVPLYLIEVGFDSGTVRMWNGWGDITAGGYVWTGTGTLLEIGTAEETSEVRAAGMQLTFSGIPSAWLSTMLAEDYQGRTVKFYVGALDTSDGSVVSTPVLIYRGKLDVVVIDDEGETASIAATVESSLIQLEHARRRRYTDNDQRAFYPNDGGFKFVAAIQDVQIVWGQASPTDGSTGLAAAMQKVANDGPLY